MDIIHSGPVKAPRYFRKVGFLSFDAITVNLAWPIHRHV